ncbi:DUF998 domain-containing protein [Nonomuraea sp. NBC_01738]|uniref:DUF998 domain-containing protein n=1 Tax=Nonomuraea sp. NBC_01738 TaxID=2976003 RepID=UPI002E15C6F3|nr:DUF998 domain-containing protein [Nonomuraea sp. NBC_01738]
MSKMTLAAAAVAAGALTYAEVALPTQTLISDYALVSGGLLPVLLGMLALAGACLSLSYGLTTREPGRSAASRVLLMAAAAGLIMSAAFPTDPDGVSTMAGEIHRWSAALVFTSLPVAGWALARGRSVRPRWNAVRSLSVVSALTLAVYLAAHPASVTSSLIGGSAYYGLMERGVVLAEIVLVAVMAVATAREHRAARVAIPATVTEPAQAPERERLAA